MLKVIELRKWWYGFSLILTLAGLAFIALGGLKLGMDFTGGTMTQFTFTGPLPASESVTSLLHEKGFEGAMVQTFGTDSIMVRTKELDAKGEADLLTTMQATFEGVEKSSSATVGATIGNELQQKAITAVIMVLVGIILYLTWAFRKVGSSLSPWAFGVNAIVALLHDIVVTVGFFAMLGYFFGVEIDVLFVTALLTVLGFSVHDTIVVFDRIREGLRKNPGDSFTEVIDRSVNETLVRSVNTSMTTILVLLALYFFGGPSIKLFILALIVGITIGTYSSIFIASPLLVFWRRR